MIHVRAVQARSISVVTERNMSNKELFKKAKELNLPVGRYALFGSAPIGVRRLRECKDIDILVTEDLWDEYRNKSEWELKITSRGTEYLCRGDIELWKNWRPVIEDVGKIIREADIIDGLSFVKLEEVIKRKKIMGRGKDLKDVELIEKFLKNKI